MQPEALCVYMHALSAVQYHWYLVNIQYVYIFLVGLRTYVEYIVERWLQ